MGGWRRTCVPPYALIRDVPTVRDLGEHCSPSRRYRGTEVDGWRREGASIHTLRARGCGQGCAAPRCPPRGLTALSLTRCLTCNRAATANRLAALAARAALATLVALAALAVRVAIRVAVIAALRGGNAER